MKVLVTGATGFVGRALVARLGAEGEDVRALVRDPSARASVEASRARVYAGSIGDPHEVAAAARGADVVVHAAAVASPRAAPRALSWTNVAGTENVVNAARHVGCKRVVLVSCADVTLANVDRIHWDEDRVPGTPLLDAHARTKLLAEELAIAASGTGIEVTAVRPTWLWGPGDTTTLPGLCAEDASGGVWMVGGGRNLLSTTYIDNLVEAIVLAARADGAPGRIYHVTDGEFIEAREFFGALCKAVGLGAPRPGLPFEAAYALGWAREALGGAGPWRRDVVKRGRGALFDIVRATAELGYTPAVHYEDGMKRLAAWAKEVGGPAAIARLARPAPDAASVDAQIRVADRARAAT